MSKARPNVQLAADQGLQEAAAQYVWNKVHCKPIREIARAKKSLRTTGAALVISKGMKRAVVLHPTGEGDFKQATVISDTAVHMMVLQSTVRPIAHGRITKYVLSEAADGSFPIEAAAPVRLLDSPMENLVRRKDHEGRPFLERDLIKAGLRLHEEFRSTGCAEQIETYLYDLLCQWRDYDLPATPAEQRALEQFRVTLEDLGPGLAEIAVRCCYFEQGLEKTEQIMGWSARSGKIVLRIALQRFKRYYDKLHGVGGGTIG